MISAELRPSILHECLSVSKISELSSRSFSESLLFRKARGIKSKGKSIYCVKGEGGTLEGLIKMTCLAAVSS
jgi:hypothetical protein